MQYFKILNQLPYSYIWILKSATSGDMNTVLDVGCGDGQLMGSIKKREWKITGIEIYAQAVEKARSRKLYSKVIKANLLKLPSSVTNRRYDLIFCSQVVEHLSKKQSMILISKLEKVASKRLVITTTNGFFEYEPIEFQKEDNNPFQKHKSGWSEEDFRKLGYVVRGQGNRFIYGPNGLIKKYSALRIFFFALSYLLSPIPYYYPKYSMYLVAVKNK